jgi:chromate reductase, NAD(P)H dehydrogenase (quinone)
MKILAISGSLRAASYNTALLRAIAAVAPEDVEVELFEGLEQLPPYNEERDTDSPPIEVTRLRRQIADADAVLISTPEYNGTMPGQLKHLIDWASRPYGKGSSLWGKPAAVIGASVSDYGAIWAQDHVRKALGVAGARALEVDLPVGRAADKFDAEGELSDLETAELLREIVVALTEHRRTLVAAA